MRKNWRERRLRVCRALDEVVAVIGELGNEDGSELPPPDGLPPAPNEAMKQELKNTAINLKRLILLHNDGQVSPSKLQGF